MSNDLAKQMWDAYAKQAGGVTFNGKTLPDWDGLGEDRQACWVAAARVAANRIEALEKALRSIAANTCCDKCQEAALVARAALGGKDG